MTIPYDNEAIREQIDLTRPLVEEPSVEYCKRIQWDKQRRVMMQCGLPKHTLLRPCEAWRILD